jgi:hypothetical protein
MWMKTPSRGGSAAAGSTATWGRPQAAMALTTIVATTDATAPRMVIGTSFEQTLKQLKSKNI